MKLNYLFPNGLKKLGWALFIPSVFVGLYWVITGQEEPAFFDWEVYSVFSDSPFDSRDKDQFTWIENNWFGEFLSLLIILGGILAGFSKEKIEDEFIAKIRLESLVWATYLNYAILALAMVFIYDFDFLLVMEINLFTLLIFFIIRFRWMLWRAKK